MLFFIGILTIALGTVAMIGEAYFERDWPRATAPKALPVIAAGLLCLCVTFWG